MKHINILTFLSLISIVSSSQSLRSIRVREPNFAVQNSSDINQLSGSSKLEIFQYLDPLNRVRQNIIKNFTSYPDSKDLVSVFEYDESGRQSKKFLPFRSPSGDGTYKSNWNTQLSDFYGVLTHPTTICPTTVPFSNIIYDDSPLDQIQEITRSGDNWQIGSNHSIKVQKTCNDGGWIRKWKIGNREVLDDGTYDDFTLYKLIKTDENGLETFYYLDGAGRLILIRSVVQGKGYGLGIYTCDETGPLLNGNNLAILKDIYTYFIYDEFNRLAYIITPPAVQLMVTNGDFSFDETTAEFDQFIYAYKYDERGRLIEKKIPGQKNWQNYVYNSNDKLILSQDPEQKNANSWNFCKYDYLGRPVIQGIYKDLIHTSRSDLQNFVSSLTQSNGQLLPLWEIKNDNPSLNFGYSNASFPNSQLNSNIESIDIINYYDTYEFNIPSGHEFIPFNNTTEASSFVQGYLTGQITRTVGLGTEKYFTSINYYNDDGELIQNHSMHILDDWDIYNNEYDFIGQVTQNIREHHYNGKTITIKSKYLYDHVHRLTDIIKQVDNENEIHMVFNQYNELGQLTKKSLHYDWAGTASYLQNIDYRYNIQGWLTSINNASLINDNGITNNDDYDAFGEEIYYDLCNENNLNSDPSVIKAQPQYNGQISAIKWKICSPNIDPNSATQHLYVYRYDDLNHMTAAYYGSDWAVPNYINKRLDPVNFDEIIDYDVLGNIKHLKRNNFTGTIDDLTYNYSGNQLTSVSDNAPNVSMLDYHTNPSGNNNYVYNDNGSIINDNNKGLAFTYNKLSLTSEIHNSVDNLTFVYDASGLKIKSESSSKINYWIDGIEYNDNKDGLGPILSYILTEEGRIRPKSENAIYPGTNRNYVFDYFLKDHIGSVRAVLSEELTKNDYTATMEQQNSSIERQIFNNLDSTRANKPAGEPIDSLYLPDNKISQLNNNLGNGIGISKVLSVNQGEYLNIDTKYFFDNYQYINQVVSVSDVLNQLASAFIFNPNSPAPNSTEQRQSWADKTFTNNQGVYNYILNQFNSDTINDPGNPQAFLIYLCFNSQFEFIQNASGVLQVKDPNVLGELAIMNLKIPANGYIYIYTNNLSNQTINFNNLRIQHFSGVLKEENHYYPYGLLNEHLSPTSSIKLSSGNKFKYSGKEWWNELSLNNYDFGARLQDPTLGRWFAVDPHAENSIDYSTYQFANSNPINFIDLNGMDPSEPENSSKVNYYDSKTFELISSKQYPNENFGIRNFLVEMISKTPMTYQGNGIWYGSEKWKVVGSYNPTSPPPFDTRGAEQARLNELANFNYQRNPELDPARMQQEADYFNRQSEMGRIVTRNESGYLTTMTDDGHGNLHTNILTDQVEPDHSVDWAIFTIFTSGGAGFMRSLAAKEEGALIAGSGAKLISQFSTKTIDEAVSLIMTDANKIGHLFDPKHNLGTLVTKLGGHENTIRAVLNAANGRLPGSGLFNNIPVNVSGHTVFLRGNVINGIPRLGTMFIK